MSLTDALAPTPAELRGPRPRVLRHESASTRWEWWLRASPSALSGFVAGLWLWDGEAGKMPTAECTVAFTLGPAGRVLE